jgi:hypothetical protein
MENQAIAKQSRRAWFKQLKSRLALDYTQRTALGEVSSHRNSIKLQIDSVINTDTYRPYVSAFFDPMEKLHFRFESHYELRNILSPFFSVFSFICVPRGFETHLLLSKIFNKCVKDAHLKSRNDLELPGCSNCDSWRRIRRKQKGEREKKAWMDSWIGGWTDGWTNRHMEGKTDGRLGR